MRYGIFSDIHSNLEALKAVITAYQQDSIDQYLCIGDIVGYAANPLECIEETRRLAMTVVAGNHDWASVNLFSEDYFNDYAKDAILWTRSILGDQERSFLESLRLVYQNNDLTLVHGTLNNPGDFDYLTNGYIAWETFRLLKTKVCFVGHTHIVGMFMRDKDDRIEYRQDNGISLKEGYQYIINVGSVGQPRDGNPQAVYCIYDTQGQEVQVKRAQYDVKAAREKIIAAGLPEFLGDRLLVGR